VTAPGAPGAPRATTPIVASDEELARITYDDRGLVAAIVQEATTRDVLMIGYMDAEALRRTLESGRTWFWSRSRQEYWMKGGTSGDILWVRSVAYDCDGDALLVTADLGGKGACHTGAVSCFYRTFGES
jgi:phosphoribosyl-AMP cyclohydrolase